MKRILVTGSRRWQDIRAIEGAIADSVYRLNPGKGPADAARSTVVVHGSAWGADLLAHFVAKNFGVAVESHPAVDFPSPRARNQHMVDLGADVCLAFALTWASGTGMCARMARKAGITTVDYGVGTSLEARP